VPEVAAYAGVEAHDARLLRLPDVGPGVRIGLCRTYQWDHAQSETVALFERAGRELAAAGAAIREVKLPSRFAELLEAHRTVFGFEMRRSFADEHLRARSLSPSPPESPTTTPRRAPGYKSGRVTLMHSACATLWRFLPRKLLNRLSARESA
jgi:Asp-tRNA(Asn)/Glu-tRNA(Gln) amidotransferase A subunit family amidase